jgi:hypothetical protein
MIFLYFDDLLEFLFYFSFGISFKKILSTNGSAFFGSLNGNKKCQEKKNEKKK